MTHIGGKETTVICASDEAALTEGLSLSQCAQAFREKLGSARSDTMLRLFDYLLAASLRGHSPKEIEIFHSVFCRGDEQHRLQDSSVRTYVHRLRHKLDQFYGSYSDPRIVIPKGEYRLNLVHKAADSSTGQSLKWPLGPASLSRQGKRSWARLALAVLAAACLTGATLWASGAPQSGSASAQAADSFLWKPLGQGTRRTVVVIGDYYLIGKSVDGRQVTHLLRDFSINSRDDLEQYLMNYPEDGGRYMDVDLSYYPVGVGAALASVLPVVGALGPQRDGAAAETMPLSRFNTDEIGKSHIVYIGLFSGLGILRNPLFRASGYSFGRSYEELVDRKSGKTYVSSRSLFDGRNSTQTDFGYIASIPGPRGNRILVVAGTRDVAAIAMAQVVADTSQIAAIESRVRGAENFEALYEIHSIGMSVSRVIPMQLRSLNRRDIWSGGGDEGRFPDASPPVGRLEGTS